MSEKQEVQEEIQQKPRIMTFDADIYSTRTDPTASKEMKKYKTRIRFTGNTCRWVKLNLWEKENNK
jgi:hypothetical protein